MTEKDAFNDNAEDNNDAKWRLHINRCNNCLAVGDKAKITEYYQGYEGILTEEQKNTRIYRSNNPAVAVVNDEGVITGVGEGVTDIVRIAFNGSEDKVPVTVYKPSVKVNKGNVTWYIPQKIKIGYRIHECTGECAGFSIAEVNKLSESYLGKSLLVFENDLKNSGFSSPHAGEAFNVLDVNTAHASTYEEYAIAPGRHILQIYAYGENGREKIGEPYEITIEEPIIKTNAPSEVKVGTTFNLAASLENTMLTNVKVSDAKNIPGSRHKPAFQPKYEILEGRDLLRETDGDFSNMLFAREKLSFTGKGIVKIKISFEHMPLCVNCINYPDIAADYYSPEKIITIQVVQNESEHKNEYGKYKIKYNLNGGRNNLQNPNTYSAKNIILKAAMRKGYLFKGWYADPGFKKKISRINAKSRKNITLYARWEKVKVNKPKIVQVKIMPGQKALVKYSTRNKVSGYQIQYSTDSKFKKNVKISVTSKKTVRIKRKGYIRIRAFRVDSMKTKCYGKFSKIIRISKNK